MSDAPRRRRVGLRFMFKVLEFDPAAYKVSTSHEPAHNKLLNRPCGIQKDQDRFLEVFMQSLATSKLTLEHKYASLLFSIDGLCHQFLRNVFPGEVNNSGDYSLSEQEFAEYRISWLDSK